MAEAFLRKYQGDQFEAHSAGMEPQGEVHPLAIKVMAEIGIDISQQKPKSVSAYLGVLPVRAIIIVCDKAGQSCPRIWPGTHSRTFIPFDDPADATGTEEEKLTVFRRVRNEIDTAMKAWQPNKEGYRS